VDHGVKIKVATNRTNTKIAPCTYVKKNNASKEREFVFRCVGPWYNKEQNV